MRKIGFLFALLAAVLLTGCGPSKVKPKGKIVQGGQPVTVSDKGVIVLSFVPTAGDATAYNATTERDGTFTIVGPEGKGIPTGKYKVQVQAMDPYAPGGGTDKLGGKFAPGQSKLEVEVGRGEVVVDVGK